VLVTIIIPRVGLSDVSLIPLFDCQVAYQHSFIQAISTAPLLVHYYSEALPTQHGYCFGVSRRSAKGHCEWM